MLLFYTIWSNLEQATLTLSSAEITGMYFHACLADTYGLNGMFTHKYSLHSYNTISREHQGKPII
jgi:hypothetical protein